jgi:hypothetical protein
MPLILNGGLIVNTCGNTADSAIEFRSNEHILLATDTDGYVYITTKGCGITGPTGLTGDIKLDSFDNLILDSENLTLMHPQDGLYALALDPSSASSVPSIMGAGDRLMFLPGNGAFRVGGVSGSQWDTLGAYSLASGFNVDASGTGAQALGYTENGTIQSTGIGSHARGSSTFGNIISSGQGSHASGFVESLNALSNVSALGDATFVNAYCSSRSVNQISSASARGFGTAIFGDVEDGGTIQIDNCGGSMAIGLAKNSNSFIGITGSGACVIGYASSGSKIIAVGDGSFVKGYSNDQNSILIAYGSGSTIMGRADNAAIQTDTSANGSLAGGHASGGSIIGVTGSGAFSFGFANDNSGIFAIADGSMSLGYADSATIISSGGGAHAFGYSEKSGMIKASGLGSFAHGFAGNTGTIEASFDGAVAFGHCDNGTITSSSFCSIAYGRALGGMIQSTNEGAIAGGQVNNGTIISSGGGAHAFGYAENSGMIKASDTGSFAHGVASGASATIEASFDGAVAFGHCDNGTITSSSFCSFACGRALSSGEIKATNEGAVAFGRSAGTGSLQSSGVGSIAMGEATTFGQLTSTADGSFAVGLSAGVNSIIQAGNGGAVAIGCANNPGSAGGIISSISTGSFAGGFADGGTIISSGNGSVCTGKASGGGQLNSIGIGSFASGYCFNSGIINASGGGSLARGVATGMLGKIEASFDGAVAFGHCDNGTITSSSFCSIACGRTLAGKIQSMHEGAIAAGFSNSGEITAKGSGSFAMGEGSFNGKLSSEARGSISMGLSDGTNSIIKAGNGGSIAVGCANAGGVIESLSTGAFAGGFADGTGTNISCSTANGSMAYGLTRTAGSIKAITEGSIALGFADGNGSIASGTIFGGSICMGFARNGGKILSYTAGSFAGGLSFGVIKSLAQGSVAYGVTLGGSTISAGSTGDIFPGFAFGTGVEADRPAFIIGKYGKTKASGIATSGIDVSGFGSISHTIDGFGSFQIGGGLDEASKSSSPGQGISVIIGTVTGGGSPDPVGGGLAHFWAVNGADYAEYFEWDDGNTGSEDRVGYFVKLVDEKIVFADNDANVIGVSTHSTHSGYIGDCAGLYWHSANLRDDFGRLQSYWDYKAPLITILQINGIEITGDIQVLLDSKDCDDSTILIDILPLVDSSLYTAISNIVPNGCAKSNPDYDPSLKYTPRSLRNEWTPVTLMGKIYVRDDGTCVVGQKCSCGSGGIAVPGTGWRVMSRKSANVIRILYK